MILSYESEQRKLLTKMRHTIMGYKRLYNILEENHKFLKANIAWLHLKLDEYNINIKRDMYREVPAIRPLLRGILKQIESESKSLEHLKHDRKYLAYNIKILKNQIKDQERLLDKLT